MSAESVRVCASSARPVSTPSGAPERTTAAESAPGTGPRTEADIPWSNGMRWTPAMPVAPWSWLDARADTPQAQTVAGTPDDPVTDPSPPSAADLAQFAAALAAAVEVYVDTLRRTGELVFAGLRRVVERHPELLRPAPKPDLRAQALDARRSRGTGPPPPRLDGRR